MTGLFVFVVGAIIGAYCWDRLSHAIRRNR